VSGKNPGHVFTLSFPSLKEKTSWFQSINGILTNQQQALGVAKGVDSSVQSIPLSSSPNTNRITPPSCLSLIDFSSLTPYHSIVE
jgi:hypothetical protein